jgi:hypothetical protein
MVVQRVGERKKRRGRGEVGGPLYPNPYLPKMEILALSLRHMSTPGQPRGFPFLKSEWPIQYLGQSSQHPEIHIISENSILRSSVARLAQLLDPDLLYISPPKPIIPAIYNLVAAVINLTSLHSK